MYDLIELESERLPLDQKSIETMHHVSMRFAALPLYAGPSLRTVSFHNGSNDYVCDASRLAEQCANKHSRSVRLAAACRQTTFRRASACIRFFWKLEHYRSLKQTHFHLTFRITVRLIKAKNYFFFFFFFFFFFCARMRLTTCFGFHKPIMLLFLASPAIASRPFVFFF
jgi:hypothetical protein